MALSSAGRALALQARCHRFNSGRANHPNIEERNSKMSITPHSLLIIAALVQFILAAVNWPPASRINLIASGLATFMVALLV